MNNDPKDFIEALEKAAERGRTGLILRKILARVVLWIVIISVLVTLARMYLK